jgi:hypothetical protein
MKAYEMPVKISNEGKLEIPESLASLLPHNRIVKVIVLIPEQNELDEDKEWASLTANEFLAGYSESDSIYDRL